jgi:hypothetical protein
MTNGLNTTWTRGPRVENGHKGKHGGPSVTQLVVKTLVPKQ